MNGQPWTRQAASHSTTPSATGRLIDRPQSVCVALLGSWSDASTAIRLAAAGRPVTDFVAQYKNPAGAIPT